MNARPRSVWGRSLLTAVALHLALAVYLLTPVAPEVGFGGSPGDTAAGAPVEDVGPYVRDMLQAMATTNAEDVRADGLGEEDRESDSRPSATTADAAAVVVGADGAEAPDGWDAQLWEDHPVESAMVEPSAAVVGRATQALLDQAGSPVAADAMGELLRKSRVLEQISNADEVSRMSAAICDAMGANERFVGAGHAEPAGSFQFETAFVMEAVRAEDGLVTTIRESMQDEAGRTLVVLTRRALDSVSGEPSYSVALVRADGTPEWMPVMRAEWDEAVVRQEPYRVINQFPLVKLLHQEAVLPIMAKLSRETLLSEPSMPAPSSTSGR